MASRDQHRFDFPYIILGAGPAGLQLGYHLEQSGRDYVILEAGGDPGAFFERFPRHRKLISINKIHTGCSCPETNLRWDWNSLLTDDYTMPLSSYSKDYFPAADVLKRYLVDFSRHFDLNVRCRTQVKHIRKNGTFELEDGTGNLYTCERLIVATGLGRPHIPDIPGIEYGECYFDFSIDPQEFVGQRVLIIGKGNSAFETAENLIETTASIQLCSPTPIKMAWKTHYVGHLRAVNNNFLDTYQLKSQNTVLDAYIENIEPRSGQYLVHILYTHAKGERRQILFDRILICAGFRFDDSLFEETCRPVLACGGKFPELTYEWESTNVQGLYFAGNLMHSRDYRRTMSGFIHGFRYNVRALGQILERKYEEKPLPFREISANPDSMAVYVVERINRSSALFLQPSFFCDLIVITADGRVLCLEDVPTDYVHSSDLGENDWYYTVTLEYGDFHTPPDPFNLERDPDPALAHLTAYLHPILRRYHRGQLVHEHHILEDLENVYSADKYVLPLVDFFKHEVAARTAAPPGKPQPSGREAIDPDP